MVRYTKKYSDLEKVENYYVIQEGSARYLEYSCMKLFNEFANSPDAPGIQNDPKFLEFNEFESIDLTSDDLNYLSTASATDYHYAVGFNIMRLLDKLQVNYKETLIGHPEKGLHEYLDQYLDTISGSR